MHLSLAWLGVRLRPVLAPTVQHLTHGVVHKPFLGRWERGASVLEVADYHRGDTYRTV